ncbi:vomeronasal type-2 receptor 26-like [Protopterus annectens]|uniref:vomeronasal type-2 receptor 26-like n=1 Tax=Protopterus annectens TaxID=7888 RepID=UPI001CFB779A|nr:vomeronasal type-2 receptor 26-like [Protopterus annectens]
MTSEESEFKSECAKLFDMFCERGYPDKFIDSIKQEVLQGRKTKIKPILGTGIVEKNMGQADHLKLDFQYSKAFVTQYSAKFGLIRKIINDEWAVFRDITDLDKLKNKNVNVVYRRGYNIKNILEHDIVVNRYSNQRAALSEQLLKWDTFHVFTQAPQSVCSKTCSVGFRKANRPGHPICCFDCIQCSEGEIANHTDSTECIKCQDDHWPNARGDVCIPKLTEFLAYQNPLGVTLAAISCLSALVTVFVLFIFAKYRNTPIVKANNRALSYVLLLGLVLCFLCSLIFIGQPTPAVCKIRQVAFGLIFVFCVSCVLSKTTIVIIAFRATKPNNSINRWVGPKLPPAIIFICMLFQVIICIVWLSVSPPFSEQNFKSQVGIISLECNEGSISAFWCMLGYMGFLSCLSFTVAFLARNLPDSFNETKFITFSMLTFVSVWLSFIPAYLSTKGKYMVAVEIFAILSSSAGLLGCIFLPKCYTILLRPDKNKRGVLTGKQAFNSKVE